MSAITSLTVAITLLLTATTADIITEHCKTEICQPCFAMKVKCQTSNKTEVVPQYLDTGITSVTLKFISGDGVPVQLKSGDVMRYPSIRQLKISGDISSISASLTSLLPNLTSFSITNTKVRSLPNGLLYRNEQLAMLSFRENLLMEIPVNILPATGNVKINTFEFSGHKNTKLPCINSSIGLPEKLSRINQLGKLILERNTFQGGNCHKMSENFFYPVRQLSYLSVAGNKFLWELSSTLTVLTRLYTLDVSNLEPYKFCPKDSHTLFESLPHTLKRLIVGHWETKNQISPECIVTPETLQSLSKLSLRQLSFGFCGGMFGTVLSYDILPHLRHLEELDLTSCHLSVIELDALAQFPRLKHLILTGNPLGPTNLDLLSSSLPSMNMLSLIDTDIRSDENFEYENPEILCDFPNLKALQLNSNSITQLPIFRTRSSNCRILTYPSLTIFRADHNQLKTFAKQGAGKLTNICSVFPNLATLSLNWNNLVDVSGIEYCTKLTSLSLSNNKLAHYGAVRNASDLTKVLSQLHSLQNLELSYNNFRVLDKELLFGMPNLHSIGLNNNLIEHLHPIQFHRNKKLKYINLSHNELAFIDPDIFSGLQCLVSVAIADTRLTSLSDKFLKKMNELPSLNELDVVDNPFYCGCDTTFRNWLKNSPMQKSYLTYMKCNEPAELKNQLVYQYQESAWNCHIKNVIIIGGSISGGFLLTLIIALPCYKYRWYIKHARLVWRAFVSSLDNAKLEHTCLYDAYVSFNAKSEEDSKWVVDELIPAIEGHGEPEPASSINTPSTTKKFRLFLEQRDSLGGTNRFTERAIVLQNCKRVLIIVSNSYLKSTDCLSEADLTGLQQHGTGFYQPDRVLLLIIEELSEELILKPPMSSLLLGKIVKVEKVKSKKKQMWKRVRQFLSKRLFTYSKLPNTPDQVSSSMANEEETATSDTDHLLITL